MKNKSFAIIFIKTENKMLIIWYILGTAQLQYKIKILTLVYDWDISELSLFNNRNIFKIIWDISRHYRIISEIFQRYILIFHLIIVTNVLKNIIVEIIVYYYLDY